MVEPALAALLPNSALKLGSDGGPLDISDAIFKHGVTHNRVLLVRPRALQ
jgi:hypothetical protein